LLSLHLSDSLKDKLVTAENIAQTAQFVESGNADAGLISMTSAMTTHLREIGNWYLVPRELYPAIEQGAVIVAASAKRAEARQLLEFLLSQEVQQRLAHSGLTPVR
jgi:molybdate transport system substrate-binding protein